MFTGEVAVKTGDLAHRLPICSKITMQAIDRPQQTKVFFQGDLNG